MALDLATAATHCSAGMNSVSLIREGVLQEKSWGGIVNGAVNVYRSMDNRTRERFLLHKRRRANRGIGKPNPKVTVYIPTHDRADMLMSRALPSVLGQTYGNLEVIVAADRCRDDTVSRVIGLHDPRIRLIASGPYTPRYPPTAENIWLCGPVTAANAALRRATGDWIARIDDDDTWTADHIEKSLTFAVENDAEFVSSSYVAERHGNRYVCRGDIWDGVRIGGTQTWLYRGYLSFFRYSANSWRKKSERVNDLDLQVRMLRAGVRMHFMDEVHAYVLPRPGSTTIGLDQYLSDESLITDWFNA